MQNHLNNADTDHTSQEIEKNGKTVRIRRKFSNNHRIATMFFDEINHELYIGYSDG